MDRLARLLVAALLLVSAVFAPPAAAADPCALCKDVRTVKCPTCLGSAGARGPCEGCDGKGASWCRGRRARVTEKDEHVAELFGVHAGADRECPNLRCEKGKVAVGEKATAQCVLCKGRGKVPCSPCRESGKQCALCKGGRTSERPCVDCGATGKLVCLLCAAPDAKCAQCEGDGVLPCSRCVGARRARQPCPDCFGRGDRTCDECHGLSDVDCVLCHGTGRTGAVGKAGGAGAACTSCEGKGTRRCRLTHHGRNYDLTQCRTCGGKGSADLPCRTCDRADGITCRACGLLAWRAADLQAGVLARAGAKDAARLLVERTLPAARGSAERIAASIAALPEDWKKIWSDPAPEGVDRDVHIKSRLRDHSARKDWLEQVEAELKTTIERLEKALAPPPTKPAPDPASGR